MEHRMDAENYYNTVCRPLFTDMKYYEAYLKTRDCLRMSGLSEKANLSARYTIANCIDYLLNNDLGTDREVFKKEFQENLDQYLSDLQKTDIGTIAPTPTMRVFSLTVKYFIATATLDQLALSVSHYYNAFVKVSGDKVKPYDYLRLWNQEINDERAASSRSDHNKRAEILAEELLKMIGDDDAFKEFRAAANKILADLVYFFQTDTLSDGERFRKAIQYLDEVLKDRPNDSGVIHFKAHIIKVETATLQIRRFGHDTNTRLGNINASVSECLKQCPKDSPEFPLLRTIAKEIQSLRAVAKLIVGEKGQQIAPEQWEKVCIGELVKGLLQERQWPLTCIQTTGKETTWEIYPPMISLVFENLMKNTVESYGRRGITVPEQPCLISINYKEKVVSYGDYAGGVDPKLGDIFEPYRSSKGVYDNVGLGLPQARKAMEVQGFRIVLANHQLPGGTIFELDFNNN